MADTAVLTLQGSPAAPQAGVYLPQAVPGAALPRLGASYYVAVLPNRQIVLTEAPRGPVSLHPPPSQTSAQLRSLILRPAPPPGPKPAAPPSTKKLCKRCNTVKPCSEFYKSRATADGYDGRCKKCDAVMIKERRKRSKRVPVPSVSVKVCRSCGLEKDAVCFYRNSSNNDGLHHKCKACFTRENTKRGPREAPPGELEAAREPKKQRASGKPRGRPLLYTEELQPSRATHEWRSPGDIRCVIFEAGTE